MVPTCLTPLKLAADVAIGLPPAEPLPAYADLAVCIEPASLARQEQVSGSYTGSRDTDHFHLAWDPTNAALDTTTLDRVEAALERSWTVMVDEAGWRAPDQTDTCLITVILADLGGSSSGTGGWTNVNAEGGVPFMVINTDWFAEGDDWIDSLLAHEFNHASQFGYNVFWEETDWWYWEATAEWSFELPFPEADTWTYSLWSYYDAPYRSIHSQVGLVNYGHFSFNVVLAEQIDPEVPRLAWEAADADATASTALEAATGEPMEALLPLYTAHVAATDVAEADVWRDAMDEFAVDPFEAHVTEYPADGAVEGKRAPQWGGQSLWHFAGTPGDTVQFVFDGVEEVDGRATDFVLTRSLRRTDGTIEHETFATTDGAATLEIVGLGDDVEAAWVGVVPVGRIGEKGASYQWTATLGAEPPLACGCGVASPWGAAAVGMAALGVARRRR